MPPRVVTTRGDFAFFVMHASRFDGYVSTATLSANLLLWQRCRQQYFAWSLVFAEYAFFGLSLRLIQMLPDHTRNLCSQFLRSFFAVVNIGRQVFDVFHGKLVQRIDYDSSD